MICQRYEFSCLRGRKTGQFIPPRTSFISPSYPLRICFAIFILL